MTDLRILAVFAAFSFAGVFSQEYDLFDSAKLEAEEFIDNLLDNHLQQFLPQSETSLEHFSCNIPKDLLLGFIPTHRDISATFSNGVVTNLSNVTRLQCRPSTKNVDGEVSLYCLLQLDQLRVQYSAAVRGFDLRGTRQQSMLRARATYVLTVKFAQKSPAPPTVREIRVMIARDVGLDLGTFGFNKIRQERLGYCATAFIRTRLQKAIRTHLTPALQKALLSNDQDLPAPRLDASQQT